MSNGNIEVLSGDVDEWALNFNRRALELGREYDGLNGKFRELSSELGRRTDKSVEERQTLATTLLGACVNKHQKRVFKELITDREGSEDWETCLRLVFFANKMLIIPDYQADAMTSEYSKKVLEAKNKENSVKDEENSALEV